MLSKLHIGFLLLPLAFVRLANGVELATTPSAKVFPVMAQQQAANLLVDPDEAQVVCEIAATALAKDIEKVTGTKPEVKTTKQLDLARPTIVIGTVGKSGLIQQLIDLQRLDVTDLKGQWESYKIVHVEHPSKAHAGMLVIVGSDRRGTAFGVFDVSRAIGVSPWHWWADVPVRKHPHLYLRTSDTRVGPPSVKYRGIFLNDEDWGLQPWAAKTFEQETGDIGPKTYAAIFELLLRLKANHVWPAMHPSTRAFNYYPANKQVADRYAIVMGSSHAEPMLRNNVDEWNRDGAGEWNYFSNRENVIRYWDSRIATNAKFENVYTVGMRGIHDSAMRGSRDLKRQTRILEQIFDAQRHILQRHTSLHAREIPQVFIPYKEVLAIYRNGLQVPDDVTLMWANDNFGYIRQLSTPEERLRSGGSGVYYHFSYWGVPHDYLWLCTTPPGLVWEEMTKAYAFGADRNWIVNVGDLKPSEIGMEWFLRLAWDVEEYGPRDTHRFLVEFAEENFNANQASDIADLLQEFYLLNFPRKPEHMGWTSVHPNTPVSESEFSHWAHGDEAQTRLEKFDKLQTNAEAVLLQLPRKYHPSFFQLVLYPIRCAANTNRKILYAEKSRYAAFEGLPVANSYARLAGNAYQRIRTDTKTYNAISNGKWQHIMSLAPRELPVFGPPDVLEVHTQKAPALAVRVEGSSRMASSITGEGPDNTDSNATIALAIASAQVGGPMTVTKSLRGTYLSWPQQEQDFVQPAGGPARASFAFEIERAGTYDLEIEANHPNEKSDSWYLQVDDQQLPVVNDRQTGGNFEWLKASEVRLAKGLHTLTITARENGAQLRGVRLVPGGFPNAYSTLALNSRPNRLPALNVLLNRKRFIDLYNSGSGSLAWEADAPESWIRLSESKGTLDKHKRIEVSIDRQKLPNGESTEGKIILTSDAQTYEIAVPVVNPSLGNTSGTYIQENGWIGIDAEQYQESNRSDTSAAKWKEIDGVGYSGVVMGLFPRLIEAELPLVPQRNAPTLEYSIHAVQAGAATLTFRALPTHEINSRHSLVIAFSIDGSKPKTLRFLQGNHERNRHWKRNVLRGSMTASTTIRLAHGSHKLVVYGLDPSVVLDRIEISQGSYAAPAYLGPRSTWVPPSQQGLEAASPN